MTTTALTVGVDIGGTNILAGVVTGDGEIVAKAAGPPTRPAVGEEGVPATPERSGFRGELTIVTATLANDAGIIGAADSARTPARSIQQDSLATSTA